MCLETSNNNTMEYNNNHINKKVSYSIKKMLKTIFKKQKSEGKDENATCTKLTLELLENIRNAEAELESENEANELIYAASSCGSSIASEYQYSEAEVYVPVHFTRTEHGTFFWTTSSAVPADADLIEPLYCCTDNHVAAQQYQGRWAQA